LDLWWENRAGVTKSCYSIYSIDIKKAGSKGDECFQEEHCIFEVPDQITKGAAPIEEEIALGLENVVFLVS
jgi:hypothetical protein